MIKKTQFSDEQLSVYNECFEFIKNNPNENKLTIRGYAGVGKTAMLSVLVSDLEKQKFKVTCTAPTNEAVRVISKSTKKKYEKTIYGILGLQLIEDEDKDPILKKTGENSINEYDVVIIDEASMIHSNLFNIICEELNMNSRVNVIFIGDPAQLPPVKDIYEESLVFSSDIKQLEMVTIQRTAKGNPIIELVTTIRNNLESSDDLYERETIINDNMGVEYIDTPEEFLNEVLGDFGSDSYKENSNFVRVLAYTNSTVNGFNDLIRRQIFKNNNPPEFIVGEKLLVDAPIVETKKGGYMKSVVYTTGERLEVLYADEVYDSELDVNYWILDVVNVEYLSPSDKREFTLFVVSNNSKNQYKRALSTIAVSAKKMLQETHTIKGKVVKKYKPGEAWKRYFDTKARFSSVRYNYALTVHKSQGSTYERAYVVERDINKLTWNNVERNKLKYVAFTRASKLLRIL